MTDLDKILLTSLTTIIGGVFVFTIGRILEKFVIEPLHDYKKTIGNITDNLIFYANIYSNPTVSSKEEKDEASKTFRKLASELTVKTYAISFPKIFSAIKIIPNHTNLINATTSLIGLSNALYNSDYKNINATTEKIKKYLGIWT